MMFRGIELKGVVVTPTQTTRTKSFVHFDNELDHGTRERWERAGYPVYFGLTLRKYFFVIDSALLSEFNTYKVMDDNKSCECGANAVKASRHSTWCPCN